LSKAGVYIIENRLLMSSGGKNMTIKRRKRGQCGEKRGKPKIKRK
jgi:hypothetical protein